MTNTTSTFTNDLSLVPEVSDTTSPSPTNLIPASINPIIPEIDPEFTFEGAYDLGAVAGGITVTENVGGNDIGDAYEFEITQAGEHTISLDGLSADADLSIFDSQGEGISVSINGSNEAETVTLDLDEGTYFAAVDSYDGFPTDYVLDIASSEVAPPPSVPVVEDPGESFDTALDLGIIQGVYISEDSVGGSDPLDLYHFSVTESTQASFQIGSLSADADLLLFDGAGEIVDASANVDTQAEIIEGEIAAGEYYLGVLSYDGLDTSYSLGVSLGESQVSFLAADPLVDSVIFTEDSTLV